MSVSKYSGDVEQHQRGRAPQHGLCRARGASNADLARACNTTPQAMIGVLDTLDAPD